MEASRKEASRKRARPPPDAAPAAPASSRSLKNRIRAYERLLARRAHASLCVTNAMRLWLQREWGVAATVLYDRAPRMFAPTGVAARHDGGRAGDLAAVMDLHQVGQQVAAAVREVGFEGLGVQRDGHRHNRPRPPPQRKPRPQPRANSLAMARGRVVGANRVRATA